MKKTLYLCLALAPNVSFATQAMLSGQGQVLTEPDYVELNITVHAQCYDTPKAASQASDLAAKKVVDFLNAKNKGDGFYNKVVTQGGYTQPFRSYHRKQEYCKDTFQKQQTITFRTQQLTGFEKMYNEIQAKVNEQFNKTPISAVESEITHVTMSNPIPKISHLKRTELEQKAYGMALENVKAKLEALFKSETLQGVKIVQVSEQPINEPIPVPRAQYSKQMSVNQNMMQESAQAPVQFDQQWLSRTLYFTFEFATP